MYKLREKSTGMYYSDPVSAGSGVMTNFSWVGNTFSTKKEARIKWLKIIESGVTLNNGKRYMPQEHDFEIEDISRNKNKEEPTLTTEDKYLIFHLIKMQENRLEKLAIEMARTTLEQDHKNIDIEMEKLDLLRTKIKKIKSPDSFLTSVSE